MPGSFYKKTVDLGLKNHYTNAMVALTKRCNASCDFCYVVDDYTEDLPTKSIFEILDKLADAGIINISLTGGEPFIRKDILEIISYAIKKDFWKVNIFTNGSLIQDNHIRFLIENSLHLGVIQLSAFSHLSEIHDMYMGIPGSLNKVIELSTKLKNAGIYVFIAFNVLDINYTMIRETVSFFKELGLAVGLGYQKIITTDAHNKKSQNMELLKNVTSVDFYCDMLNYYNEKSLLYEKDRFSKGNSDEIYSGDKYLCDGIITTIDIDSQGNIRPCVSFNDLIIGNIFEEGTLYELVQKSDELKKIKSLRMSDLHLCKTCKHKYSCNVCIGMIHSETGCLDKPSEQFCNYAKAVEEFLVNHS